MPRNEPVSCPTCGHGTKVDNIGVGTFLVRCTDRNCMCSVCKFHVDLCPGRNEAIKKFNAHMRSK